MRILTNLLLVAALDGQVKYVGKAKYLNNARAVVTHTFDDTVATVVNTLDALDKYGVKATAFVSTERRGIENLWPRLNQAIAEGHEVGSHSRRHQCKWPDTEEVCRQFYDDYEVMGSREDILKNTGQPYVWSWCYPCGNCAGYEFAWKQIEKAGYLAARNYPGEAEDGHVLPNLQTWAVNPFNSAYTGVVQKKGGIAKSGRTDVGELNAKFDEVYAAGGIYHFLSHPAWLDFGADAFYEKHLAHIGKKTDVWYAPFGPVYAYQSLREKTEVTAAGKGKFAVKSGLDPKKYNGAVTLEFSAGKPARVWANGKALSEKKSGLTDRWTEEYWRRDGAKLFVTMRPGALEFR